MGTAVETFLVDTIQRAAALPRNALTVDVEEYFQVAAFEQTIQRDQWVNLESRVRIQHRAGPRSLRHPRLQGHLLRSRLDRRKASGTPSAYR